MVCLHGTDPATVYLSARARTDEMTVADMDLALYRDRSLVKQLAMRRTLFVFPRESLRWAQAQVEKTSRTSSEGAGGGAGAASGGGRAPDPIYGDEEPF